MKKLLLPLLMSVLIQPAAAKTTATLPLDEIRNFVDVYNTIKNEYVEEKDGKTLIDFAIEGMLNGLDPHSVYLKKSLLKDFTENTNGSYIGFGFSLEMNNGRLIVVAPIADSPAEKAGIRSGDQIVKIDDTIISKMNMPEVSELLKNKQSVKLTIERKDTTTKVFTLARSTVILPSVSGRILDKDYGYIRVSEFQANTAEQFDEQLKKQLQNPIKGLVLDLRNNPGGLVHAATEIADDFLTAGLIVSTKNQNNGSEEKVHAYEETMAKDLPLVVLINEGSASASELLAGALQSHNRAVIVGQPSFGKGSNLLSYGEANIAGHLHAPNSNKPEQKPQEQSQEQSNDEDKLKNKPSSPPSNPSNELPSADSATPEKATIADHGDALAKSDLQLFEALNVLKVLNFKK
ncbi:MAG: peptidase S41 [Gammaproteobacteria bacterium]|nr:MAG: peptidase S41 [Gammaproteobacteria bacterium]